MTKYHHIQARIGEAIDELSQVLARVVDLSRACRIGLDCRMLRYLLLVDVTLRDELYKQLRQKGLGASIMYPFPLPGIPGVADFLSGQTMFPAAEDFAGRILTLPTRSGVNERDITQMREIFLAYQ